MTLQSFLTEISDERGALQSTATDIMERMSKVDFEEFVDDIKCYAKERIESDNFIDWLDNQDSTKNIYQEYLSQSKKSDPI